MGKLNESIIDEVINGTATQEEAREVVEWFATEEGQLYLSERIDTELYKDKDLINALMEEQEIPSDDIYSRIKKRLFKKRIYKISTYAAAIILPLVIVFWGLARLDSRVDLFGNTEYVDVYAAKGERLQVMFQDGSTAYLNSDTKLRYPKKFGYSDRKIYLNGEAYFVVEKNPKRPFIIEMDSAAVNVLGTSFNIEAYNNDRTISVVLDEGKVNLQPLSTGKEYSLKPGEKLIYDKYNGSCVVLESNTFTTPKLWKDDAVYLHNRPLEDVLKVLDRKYDIRFEVEDEDVMKYSYTILISKNTSLERVLYDLEMIAPVVFHQEKGDTIIVKIRK